MSVASKTVPSRLGDIVGPAHLLLDPKQLAVYEVNGIRPASAVLPRSPEEVAEIVKFAASEKMAVIATAARTKLGIGAPPRQYDLAMDMTRLDRVVAYDPADLTLSVEAGIPLRKLAAILLEHRQFLPLAVPFLNETTVGGTIASGVDSPLRQFYGTARDFVLGMEFVTGEGVPAKSGGRVVKNVSGYDLHKLMIGALGTLGVITRINFKTFPVPAVSHGFVATFENAGSALNLRHRIAHSPLTPLTLDILSPGVTEIFSSHAAAHFESAPLPVNLLSRTYWALTAAFTGNEKVLERYANDLRRMALEAGAVNSAVLDDEKRPAVWGRLREFIAIALKISPAATILKLSLPPMQMKDVLEEAGMLAAAEEIPWAAVARGLGIVYFVFLPAERNEESRKRVARAADQIQRAGASRGGSAIIPWCPAEWKNTLKVWGSERGDFSEMQKVKKVFDPSGILAPGRFVGGL